MDSFTQAVMDKHAGVLSNIGASAGKLFNKIPWVQKYKQVAASPGFKAKKIMGTAALAAAPTAYVGYQLTKSPEPLQKNTIPGIPPSYQ